MKQKQTLFTLCLFACTLCFGQLKLEDLKIDTTITGFHFAANFQGTQVFTKNGPTDLKTMNPSAYSFTLAPGMNAKSALDQFDQLLNWSKQGGYKVTDIVKKDTTLAGNPAFYVSYTETDEKKAYQNLVFNAFVIKAGTLILFTSGDLDRGKYTDKFKKTFFTVKL